MFQVLHGTLPVCNYGLTAVGLCSPGVTVHVCASVACVLLHMTVHECRWNSVYASAVSLASLKHQISDIWWTLGQRLLIDRNSSNPWRVIFF